MRKAAMMVLLQHRGHLRQTAKVSGFSHSSCSKVEVDEVSFSLVAALVNSSCLGLFDQPSQVSRQHPDCQHIPVGRSSDCAPAAAVSCTNACAKLQKEPLSPATFKF